MRYYATGQPYDNGTNPQVDAILSDIANEYHTPVPKYKLGMPMEKPNVLGTYDTDTKVIEFKDNNPSPNVVAHEGFHSVHDALNLNCFLPDEPLLGDNIQIAKVQRGATVLATSAGSEPIVSGAEVLDTFTHQYSGQLITVKARGMLPLTATPEHPVMVANVRFVEKQKPTHHFEFKSVSFEWKKISEIKPGNCLVFPKLRADLGHRYNIGLKNGPFLVDARPYIRRLSATTKKILNRKRFLRVTKDVAWLMGVYCAEGYVTKGPSAHVEFSIGRHERYFRKKIFDAAKRIGCGVASSTVGSVYKVRLGSYVLAGIFGDLIGKDCYSKRIPDQILFGHRATLAEFLRGYCQGDGWASPQNLQLISTSSKVLALQIQQALSRFNIFASLYEDRKKEQPGVILGRAVNLHKSYVARWIWQWRVKTGLPMRCKMRRIGTTNVRRHKMIQEDEERFFPIVTEVNSAEYTGTVHNIETTTHTYQVCNLVTHNCSVAQCENYAYMAECFPSDTLVGGTTKISQVKVGDQVLTHTGRVGTVEAVKSFAYNGEIVKIYASHYSVPLMSTPDHPYYAIAASQVLDNRGRGYSASPCFVRAKELKAKDFLLMPIDSRVHDVSFIRLEEFIDLGKWRYSRRKIYTQPPINEEFMRFIGLYIGDGYTGSHMRVVYFSFGPAEETLARDTADLASRIFNVSSVIRKKSNSFRVEIPSTFLARFLVALVGRGAHNKKIPEWMMLLPVHKQEALLKGLIESDGYEQRGRTAIRTTSEALAYQIHKLYLRQGKIASLYRHESPLKPARFKDGHLARSGVSFDVVIHNRHDWQSGCGWAKGRVDGSYAYLPIRKVERGDYNGEVWNLDIDSDETFTVGMGFAVHNSAYGKSRGLYRLEHNPAEHKVYFREYNAAILPSSAQALGAVLLLGAAAAAGYEFFVRKKKPKLGAETGLMAGAGVVGAYLLTRK